MKKLIPILITFIFASSAVISSELSGDVRSWTMDDFLGLDRVGDCKGDLGDITSLYARLENGNFLIRVSFDDMASRASDGIVTDRFEDRDLMLLITFFEKDTDTQVDNKFFGISSISYEFPSEDGLRYLRTPGSNLLEVAFSWYHLLPVREDMDIRVQLYVDLELADEFRASGSGSKDVGNCAFVHHGNQGLTYTNVFYGDPNGISGLDGSGYDEVLEVHVATGIPGNFHMSGTLMPAAEWHNPEFNNWLDSLASQGIAAMMTSALGQHIMPFMYHNMNEWSVYIENQMVQHFYNYTPRVAWVPERVWLAPGYYPDAGVIDWLGDNWEQYGIWGVVLDDWPHLSGYNGNKIHWMNNGSGVTLRVIPIDNGFVGKIQSDATSAKNHIAGMGQYNICVFGTDWEVVAEMNEHDGTWYLDNYESVLWYCYNNYPGVNVWKLEDAIMNSDFNGSGADITKGTYGLLGGTGGYGGSNNSWYMNWAATPSHSDNHSPQWDYETVWKDAYNFLMGVSENSLSQLGWYTMMINLHETGWHTDGQVADWEHRYSSHIKNANVYTEASRWADGQYTVTTGCYFSDIDHDGTDELVMHNDKVFFVIESIGGKANWVFYKNGFGQQFSVVGSDVAYWSETDGDYNESSNNHVAALSDVYPNQQHSVYNMVITQPAGDTVSAVLDQWGVQKTLSLTTGKDFLDVIYDFFGQTGYIKSGWTPDLLDLIWSGKGNLQRVWGDYGSYCGYRNSSSGATVALVLGNGGGNHNLEFEGTLVRGDEVSGYGQFKMRLYAGYTSQPTGTEVPELDLLANQNMDVFPPQLFSPAFLISDNAAELHFSEALDETTAENISNYTFQNFGASYTVQSAERLSDWSRVKLTITGTFVPGDMGQIVVSGVEDLQGNVIGQQNTADLTVPSGYTPHAILIDGTNDFLDPEELIESQLHDLYVTWDDNNLYVGFYSMDLNSEGDLFVNIDTDQTAGSGAATGSWGRVNFAGDFLPEYQVAIEGGGGSMQVNDWTGSGWNYPGNGAIGNSYEGWASNGFTEISVPWSALGDPAGIALSVHITEEDSYMVPEIFPSLNTAGNNPTITYFYAFFQPFIPGPMPLNGYEPRNVIMVPNTAPQITTFNPPGPDVVMEVNTSQLFSVTASDAENDEISYSWKLDGLEVSATNQFTYQPIQADIGLHSLMATVTDNVPGNIADTVSWNITVTDGAIIISLKVFLGGPWSAGQMATTLNGAGFLPLSQPYFGAPWYYTGTETVAAIPNPDVVDWVLVELRETPGDATTATGSTSIGRQAAFLLKNGDVVGMDGSSGLSFLATITENLYAVVWHRNHLGIISSNPLQETGGVYAYDFTTSSAQVLGGITGYSELEPGVWGMAGGDGNSDGQINNGDKIDVWTTQAGSSGYLQGDFSMDSQVNNGDKNDVWVPNTGKGGQVPDWIEKYGDSNMNRWYKKRSYVPE